MAPQQPDPKQQRSSRPSSGASPSPTKSSPHKSTERRTKSGDPKRRSAPAGPAAADDSDADSDIAAADRGSPRRKKHSAAEKRRSQPNTPTRAAAAAATAGRGGWSRESPPKKKKKSSSPNKTGASSPTKGAPRISSGAAANRHSGSPRKSADRRGGTREVVVVEESAGSQTSSSNALSADSLAKLNDRNAKDAERERKVREKESKDRGKVVTGRVVKERTRHKTKRRNSAGGDGMATPEKSGGMGVLLTEKNLEGGGTPSKKRRAKERIRAASGSVLEAGLGRRGGYLKSEGDSRSRRRRFLCIGAIVVALLLIILVPVGVLVIGKQSNSGDSGSGDSGSSSSGGPNNSNLNGIDPNSIPPSVKGSYLDPFTWYDTQDFNLTYTPATLGGLPVMGLNSTWDDSVQANQYVPALDKPFAYGAMPIRGINVGGWLSLEPFITPSLFNSFDSKQGVIDEYTLCQTLGASQAAKTLEKHYSSFINAAAFAEIRGAGFDHVRIPYSYWAVTTYTGDPYVPKISWRYLLRGIEYARQNGLRVNLDLHGVPGSQNGWNHSGRQGAIGWLNGTDGATNGQRSLDIHRQLSTFFAQPRYKNVVAIYGLVNEPKMTALPTDTVLEWTTSAVSIIRQSGMLQWIAFGDGFLGLPNWQGKLQGMSNLVMDAHQYVIFNQDQIAFDHKTKLGYACAGWSGQMSQSINTATGFGPTLCGEWSQADTDCTQFLNNVGVGTRWEGTMDVGDPSLNVLTPSCPLKSSQCSCNGADADASGYSGAYKQWLRWNAEAQMDSFEIGFGWFYWTWLTESAVQWSWSLGMQAGILPQKVWDRDYNCSAGQSMPDWGTIGLPESY